MFLRLAPEGSWWPLLYVALIFLATLAVKFFAKTVTKSDIPLSSCTKAVIYISTAGAILFFFVGGPADVSRPVGRAFAHHWQKGMPTDCQLCPDRLFVIICDADKWSHIRNLRELASLDDRYPCIKNRSFRLKRLSGAFGGPYDENDAGFRKDISYKVTQESVDAQTVEVRFNDSMVDIIDALFRYEVRNGKIVPLESWVLVKIQFALLGMLVIFVSALMLWPLCVGIVTVFRLLKSRQRGRNIRQ